MTTREATKTYRLNQWTQIIRECRSSGLKVNDWCKENDINPKKYYYWLSQVRKAATCSLPAKTADSSIVPVQLPQSDQQPPFTHTVSSNDVVATISIGNVVIQLSNQASSDFILNVMKAMQHVR